MGGGGRNGSLGKIHIAISQSPQWKLVTTCTLYVKVMKVDIILHTIVRKTQYYW